MSTGTVPPAIVQQFFDELGLPVANGTLTVYAAGTTNLATIYSNVLLTIATANPIPLDGSGFMPQVFLAPSSYRFQLKKASGALLWDRDNESSVPPSNIDIDVIGIAGEALNANDVVYVSDGSGGLTAGRWYKTQADLPYASSDAAMIGMMPAALAAGSTGTVRLVGRLTGLGGLAAGGSYYCGRVTAGFARGALALFDSAEHNQRFIGVADSATTFLLRPAPRPAANLGDVIEGRLSVSPAATYVPANDVTGASATTLFYRAYRGVRISLYDGTRWNVRLFDDLSIAVPATTNTLYDVFVWDNAGQPTLQLVAWTNDTTRASAITRQDGRLVLGSDSTRRYLGLMRTTGVSGQSEDSAAKRYVWNLANQLPTWMRVQFTGVNTYAYSTNTWRQVNADATYQLDCVVGQISMAEAVLLHHSQSNNVASQSWAGIGVNGTTAPDAACMTGSSLGFNVAIPMSVHARVRLALAVGRNTLPALEKAVTGTITWTGNSGTGTLSGIDGWIMA